ncbi:MAG: FAD-dependent oxidoreductase [Syntrophales bacterium]|nr:FAD-dependent oxidoreductase [Syntrophales bacterium]
MITINTGNLYYKTVNRQIRESLSRGEREIVLTGVLGQRYIGGGISADAKFAIHGVPGQDLGAFMNGPEIRVYGNAQDGVANTMNAGKIVVHGKAGEIPGHSMRGGKLFIEGDVEYRAGIHMKEYLEQIPILVIGGTTKDYCGEYMAGGRIVVLNLQNRKESPVGNSTGTGIHGGAIYVRGQVALHQLGIGAVFAGMDDEDRLFLDRILEEYAAEFDLDPAKIGKGSFVKITKKGKRPFGKLYTPGMNVKDEPPHHFNLTPPCAAACPTGIPTPVFLNLIKDGKLREAQLLMDEYSPFRMAVCGTVCPALCMEACSRNMIDGPVRIQDMAREYYPDFDPVLPKELRPEKVSVIGAGPAGLSAAWQLARRGYAVEVYEGRDDLGGKVRSAIPRARLSDDCLGRDMERIQKLPITFHLGTFVDKESFAGIVKKSDAVLVAAGAHKTKRIPYPGGDRIVSGLDFLVSINDGNAPDLSRKKVAVIGAGNVGMDIACEAWRLGATAVAALDIQKPLAFGKELELARELGTKILWPQMIERLDDTTIYFKGGGSLEADVVFFSIGEAPEAGFLGDTVFLDERGYVATAEHSFMSSNPKVYACGDIRRPGLATDAIGQGRLAAMEIHAMLKGETFIYPAKIPVSKKRVHTVYFEDGRSEIDRCLSCGTCIFCDTCVEHCPQGALSRNGEIFTIDTNTCTMCYTCVAVCPRGAMQPEFIPAVGEPAG